MISLKDFREFKIDGFKIKGGEDPCTGGGFELIETTEFRDTDGSIKHINTYKEWDSDWNDGRMTYFGERLVCSNPYQSPIALKNFF